MSDFPKHAPGFDGPREDAPGRFTGWDRIEADDEDVIVIEDDWEGFAYQMPPAVLILAGKIGPAFGGAEIRSWGSASARVYNWGAENRELTLDFIFRSMIENLDQGAGNMDPEVLYPVVDFKAPLMAVDFFG